MRLSALVALTNILCHTRSRCSASMFMIRCLSVKRTWRRNSGD